MLESRVVLVQSNVLLPLTLLPFCLRVRARAVRIRSLPAGQSFGARLRRAVHCDVALDGPGHEPHSRCDELHQGLPLPAVLRGQGPTDSKLRCQYTVCAGGMHD